LKHLFICLFLLPSFSYAQKQTVLGAGEYPIDSTECKLCDSVHKIVQYYQARIKYPLSSEAITDLANKKIALPPGTTGYVTIRFIVNCKGEKNCFHIYQTDKESKTTNFGDDITGQFLEFVKDMPQWSVVYLREQAVDYYAYLTFKLNNGKIENVIP
jgi:hypothetical protein